MLNHINIINNDSGLPPRPRPLIPPLMPGGGGLMRPG